MSNYELRAKAMDLLREKYSLPIAYVFITMIVNSVIGSLTPQVDTMDVAAITAGDWSMYVLMSVVAFLVNAGILFGAVHMWRSVALQATPNLETALLSGFKTGYGRNVLLSLLTNVYVFLWSLLFIIPGIVKSNAFSMAFYFVNREPGLSSAEALRTSEELTRGYKGQLFGLDVSYLGWYFLGLFTFGILWLWIIPRHNTARMILFEELYEAHVRRTAPPADPVPAAEH